MKHFAVYHDFVNIYTVLNIFHIDSNNIDNNFVCTPMFPTLVNQKSFPTFQMYSLKQCFKIGLGSTLLLLMLLISLAYLRTRNHVIATISLAACIHRTVCYK